MTGALVASGVVALLVGEWIQLTAIAITAFVTLFLSASLLLLTPKPARPARPKDGLAVLALWWVLAALIGAGPFAFDAYQGWVTAPIHESVSSLTTTGHVALVPVSMGGEWPKSLLVWRAMLHLIGALTSLVSVASIFAALNLGGPGIHRTVLFTIPDGSFFDALPRLVITASSVMGGSIFLLFCLMALNGVPVPDAASDAVSIATTGLVDPGRAGEGPLNAGHAAVIFGGLILATVGLAVVLEAGARRWLSVLRDPEFLTFMAALAAISGLVVLAGASFLAGIGWGASLLSTSGIPIVAPEAYGDLPLVLAVVPALIGGSALSTAGGLKLARVYLLFARAGEEFARLGFRDSVVVIRYRDRILPDSAVVGIWVYLVAYVSVIAALIVANTLCNMPFGSSVATAVGLISNTGSLVDLSQSNRPNVSDMIAIGAMLLGRLEIIAVIPVLSWSFWRA